MDGIPLDVILVVTGGFVAVAMLVAFISRKLAGNPEENADGASPQAPAAADQVARHPGGECAICLSDEVESPVQTNCGHWYCAGCILGWIDSHRSGRISCPVCRQEVTMIHRGVSANAPEAAQQASPPVTPDSPAETETQALIGRFNERSSGRQRTLWQTVRDSPLLLRRLWFDLRRGDSRMIRAMIGRGVQLQVLIAVVYIVCPFDLFPESLFGFAGLLDDFMIALVLLLYITTVYRTILLSWERARIARAAATTAAAAAAAAAGDAGGPVPTGTGAVPGEERGVETATGPGRAAFLAVAAGALATFAGAGSGFAALAAGLMGVLAAALPPLLSAGNLPPLAQQDR